MAQLTGNRLRWFDGRVFLGTGNTLSGGPLPPGINHIILVARDPAGLKGADSVTVVVSPAELPFLRLAVPHLVESGARAILVRALAETTMSVTIRRRTFGLTAGVSRVLRVLIAPGKAPILLEMAAGFDNNRIPFAALVRRR